MGYGKGITLVKRDKLYVCNEGGSCAERATHLKPRDRKFLETERRKLGG